MWPEACLKLVWANMNNGNTWVRCVEAREVKCLVLFFFVNLFLRPLSPGGYRWAYTLARKGQPAYLYRAAILNPLCANLVFVFLLFGSKKNRTSALLSKKPLSPGGSRPKCLFWAKQKLDHRKTGNSFSTWKQPWVLAISFMSFNN